MGEWVDYFFMLCECIVLDICLWMYVFVLGVCEDFVVWYEELVVVVFSLVFLCVVDVFQIVLVCYVFVDELVGECGFEDVVGLYFVLLGVFGWGGIVLCGGGCCDVLEFGGVCLGEQLVFCVGFFFVCFGGCVIQCELVIEFWEYWELEEFCVIGIVCCDDFIWYGDVMYFLQCLYWVGYVLEYLVCVYDVEGVVGEVECVYVFDGEVEIGQVLFGGQVV